MLSPNMLQGSPNEGKNAFHFLMESRNKIIGQNPSGKDLNLANSEDLEQKQKLAQRRSILQEWADDKGASKRKREDEEKEACIKVKMKKRAKRLKNMLENLDNDDDFQRKPRKKRVKRIISSESENSKDGNANLDNNETKNEENKESVQKPEGNIIENNSTETHNKEKLNNDLVNNGRILRPRHKKTTLDSPNGCKNGWKMKIKPPKSEKTSNSDSEFTVSNKTSKKHSKKQQKLEIVVSSGSDNEENNETKSVKKLAPIFVSKPKIDPEVMEARRKFLLSGIPSTLKKVIDKQKSVENREFVLFPKISHVQQKSDLHMWNLPKAELKTTENSTLQIKPYELVCSGLICRKNITLIAKNSAVQKMDTLKNTIKYIKSTNPDYPVFKSFRHIYKKCRKYHCGKTEEKTKSDEMWSEKYKPSCSEEFLGNQKSINALKSWLETWKNYSEEINSKRKRRDSNSESEFEGTDSDSRDSIKNTVVLGGPSGSGKTAAVYAICNELGINILELNASSKRTGKKLVQELQEATQSHQVRKGESGSKCFKKDTNKSKDHHKKLCVLLVEDVDVVFEQDDGFISAVTQLTITSKRPIILTTTDDAVVVTQKYLSQYELIQFSPFSSSTLSVWLQIVCISEGLLVNKNDISSLLEYHKGDARRTLLQLQFLVSSEQKNVISPVRRSFDGLGNEKEEEEDIPLDCLDFKAEDTNVEPFQVYCDYNVPYEFNFGLLWWNVPNLLCMPGMCKTRLSSDNTSSKIDSSVIDKNKLNSLSRFYDALAFADVSFKKCEHYDGNEPEVFSWSGNVKDSLELSDHSDSYNDHIDFVRDLSHTLINDSIREYNGEESKGLWDMAVPGPEERRWRYKIHSCENFLQEALTLSSNIERKSIALDYMPVLRNVARTEGQRAASNTKRGNRFRNYLKNLNISFNDNMCKLACNILQVDE